MIARRFAILAAAAFGCLIFSACKAVPARRTLDEALAAGSAMSAAPMIEACCPPEVPVDPMEAAALEAASAPPPPLPYCPVGPWQPPGIDGKWPPGEYLCDGGDHEPAAKALPDAEIVGLNVEDTIAHYDTIACGRKVQPSNCVCLYAPRFGSIRKVVHPLLNEQVDITSGIEQPVAPVKFAELQEPTTALQNIPPQVGTSRRKAANIESSVWPDVGTVVLTPEAVQDSLAPYANISVIRAGIFQQNEKALLARGVEAAITWTLTEGVSVLIDHQAANEVVGDQRAEAVYTIKNVPGCPMLRVIKVASTQAANPGDLVDFTIRFDNVGTETLQNVTVVDNLTTRLEYVADSAKSSVKAAFSTQPNQAGSLVLRWEIANPIKPFEGGLVRFTCRVR